MVDMAAISGFATSMRAAVEITKAMTNIRDANMMQTKIFKLTREIMAAQSDAVEAVTAQSDLLQRVRQLEEEKAKLETWNAEKGRYDLKAIVPGVTVYALKKGMEHGEEPHYLCPTCYNRGQKSILQQETRTPGMIRMQVCHECSTELIEHGQRFGSPTANKRRS
jgi:hypothetical protein